MIHFLILKVKDPDNIERFRAIINLDDALSNPDSSRDLINIQNNYSKFIEETRLKLNNLFKNPKNRSNSRYQWRIADKIFQFLINTEKQGYLFENRSEALSRDIGLSKTNIHKLINFRIEYPNLQLVNNKINWSKYREILEIQNKVARKTCEEKILKGELKNEKDIRKFKKTIIKSIESQKIP